MMKVDLVIAPLVLLMMFISPFKSNTVQVGDGVKFYVVQVKSRTIPTQEGVASDSFGQVSCPGHQTKGDAESARVLLINYNEELGIDMMDRTIMVVEATNAKGALQAARQQAGLAPLSEQILSLLPPLCPNE